MIVRFVHFETQRRNADFSVATHIAMQVFLLISQNDHKPKRPVVKTSQV